MANPFFTIGHSVRPLGVFIGLLKDTDVRLVVDVRAIPRSRTNPQYNGDTLPSSLSGFQIGYDHIAELVGRRGRFPPPWTTEVCRNTFAAANAAKAITSALSTSLNSREGLDHFIKYVFKLGALIWREFVQARFINLQFPVLCELGLCFEYPSSARAPHHRFSLNGPGIHPCLYILNEIIKLQRDIRDVWHGHASLPCALLRRANLVCRV
jgi:hypothetical protein